MNQKTETSATETSATPAPKDISNGVARPKAGTATGRVWQICDELSSASNAPAERAQVITKATAEGINAATAATQHGKWRKYHGLVAAASPEAKAEKAKADAAAKAKKAADAKAKKDTAAASEKAKKDAAAAAAAAGSSDVTVQSGAA